MGVILASLDHFRHLNNTHGPRAGDGMPDVAGLAGLAACGSMCDYPPAPAAVDAPDVTLELSSIEVGQFTAVTAVAIPNAGPPLDWNRAFERMRSAGHASPTCNASTSFETMRCR